MDTSEAAVKQRMDDLSMQATNLALTSDLEKTPSERVNMFYEFVEVCVSITLYAYLSVHVLYIYIVCMAMSIKMLAKFYNLQDTFSLS